MQLPVKQRIGDTTIEIAKIRIDGGTQPREGIDENVAREYGQEMTDNGIGVFDPVTIFYDGKDYWLADGYHRVTGAKMFDVQNLRADIRQGTRRDAILFSTGANGKHGLRRTNADKRRAVMTMLTDEDWSKWSDNRIAQHCNVSQPFVSAIRGSSQTSVTYNDYKSTVRQGSDGRTIDTANIGKGQLLAHLPATLTAVPGGSPKPPRFPVIADVFYPVDTLHRIIYNDPRRTPEEIPAPYRADSAKDLLTQDRFEAFRFVNEALPESSEPAQKPPTKLYTCDQCKKQVGMIYRDFRTQSALCGECYEARLKERDSEREARRAAIPLQPDKWYPIRHPDQAIYNDPFDSQALGAADARYRPGYAIQNGRLIIDGILRDGNYAKYQIVPAMPEVATTTEQPGAQLQGEWRYQQGMAAFCGKCEAFYNIASPTYTNWQPSDKPGIWECPQGHRVSDALMRIVDEPQEQPAPDSTPEPKALAYRALNEKLRTWFKTLKVYNKPAARQIMKIALNHGSSAAEDAAYACMMAIRTNEKVYDDLVRARTEIEMLHRVMKDHRVSIPQLA